MIAGAIRSRIAAASSGPVLGDLATLEGSMMLMPIVPSDAVSRTTTHFVAFFETPALVNVPTNGIATSNTSNRSICNFIAVILVVVPMHLNRPARSLRLDPRRFDDFRVQLQLAVEKACQFLATAR